MFFLLDTNAVRDAMDGNVALASRLTAAMKSPNRVVVPVVVLGEVLHGIERLQAGKRRDALEHNARTVLGAVNSEAVPVEAAAMYSKIKCARELAGTPMAENDLWIAATALALDGVLVTRDTDFHDVAGLTIEDWTK